MRGFGSIQFCVILAVGAICAITVEAANRNSTHLVSVSTGGGAGNDDSEAPSVSANGRWIVFQSAADNLAPRDRNETEDIFLHDTRTRRTRLISVNTDGEQADGYCAAPAMTPDGRFVAFHSTARNLDPVDTNLQSDVYVRDLMAGVTELVSISVAGDAANAASQDAAISSEGRYVVFESLASNLVPDDTNGVSDMFLRDRVAGVTVRVSVGADGAQASHSSDNGSISGDGRSVGFRSHAPGLVPGDQITGSDYFVRDLAGNTTERLGVPDHFNQAGFHPVVFSHDGRFVAFDTSAALSGVDSDPYQDVYLQDRTLSSLERISAPLSGSVADHMSDAPSISADGRFVSFSSRATHLVDLPPNYQKHVYVRDRERQTTELVSLASNGQLEPGAVTGGRISGNGLAVAFVSERDTRPPVMPRSQVYLRTRKAEYATPRTRLTVKGQTSFPTTAVGTDRSRVFLLTNRGRGTLRGTVGAVTEPFQVSSGAGSFTIPAGGVYSVVVTFKPQSTGVFKTELGIDVDGNPPTSRVLRLKGRGR
jgi:Tol biopolymer transport system component